MYTQVELPLMPTSGVWVQSVSGKYYTADEWPVNGEVANGVAVFTDACSFVIALEDAYYDTVQWGASEGESATIPGVTETTSVNAARQDYDGENQTTRIINYLQYISTSYGSYENGWETVNGCPAATYASNYIFPNGKNGYLPAFGELYLARQNWTDINSAIIAAGGNAPYEEYWSSTLDIDFHGGSDYYDYEFDDYAWYAGMMPDTHSTSEKRNGYAYVRAFSSI